ncbi:MAG: hypothetical protein ACI8QS_002245 [Planctomycetota bacterium]|jgi:hypothetical protein
MEVRGQQPGGADEARARFHEVQAEAAKKSHERIEEAREALRDLSLQRHKASQERLRAEKTKQAKRTVAAEESAEIGGRQKAGSIAEASSSRGDKIEISSEALAAQQGTGRDEERAARVAELQAAYRDGTLSTPERVEQAATRMLGGGDAAPDAKLNEIA